MDEATFWRLFGRNEHEQLDFKRGVGTGVGETFAAMAMTEGGLVVHGVDDERRVVGSPLSQNTQDRITRVAAECGLKIRFRRILVANRELTISSVPAVRNRIVTTPDGRLLRRVGSESRPLRGDAMARFVRDREPGSAEDEPVGPFQPADLDSDVLNAVRRAEGRPPARLSQVFRALVDLGVAVPAPTGEPQPTRAGAVLFAKDPRTFLRGAAVQLVRRTGIGPGPGPSAAREECAGPLSETVACCLDFVGRHTKRFEAVTGARREVIPEYPETVVREAIVNALAHRDYGLEGATVDVTVWDDRLEVRSPGPLPGHITVENMRREHYSRNPRIMRVLKAMGFVEEYGDGVDRMYRDMETRLMEPPVFTAASGSVTVTLRNRFLVDVEDQVWLMLLGHEELSAAERLALVMARQRGQVTPRELRKRLPGQEVRAVLKGAVAKGLLVLVGERGGSRYVLSDEIVLRAGGSGLEARKRTRQTLMDEMERRGSLSSAEGADLLGETTVTARVLLNDLVHKGMARAEGRTRGRRYFPR